MMESARYSTPKTADSVILYLDEYERKDFLGNVSFNICDWFIQGIIYVLWIISLPLTWYFSFKVIPHFERVVVFRLGRVRSLKGPGLITLIPCIDTWKRVDMRMRAFKVPPQDILTLDHALIKLGADVEYCILDPISTYTLIQDIDHCLRVNGQSVMTTHLCQNDLASIEGNRLSLQQTLQLHMNETVREWGIEIVGFELSNHSIIKTPGGLTPASSDDHDQDDEGGTAAILNVMKSFISGSSSIQMPGMMPGRTIPGVGMMPGVMSGGLAPRPSPRGAPASVIGMMSVEELFSVAKGIINEELCRSVNASFEFHVTDEHVTTKSIWFVDLKNSPGLVTLSQNVSSSSCDVRFHLSGGDLQKLFYGLLKPQDMYMSGQLAIEGNTNTAMKLELIIQKMQSLAVSS